MHKIIILFFMLFASSVIAGEVNWAENYKSGIEQAVKEKKPVLFIISRDTCKYCVLLDNTTLKDEKVVQMLTKNFVAIRSWTNEGDYIPQMIRQNTPGLPGIWFLYSDGTPMYQPVLGYMDNKNLLHALEVVKKEFDKNSKGKK